ncbi:Transcription antitermination protein RfaH [Pseudoalteromonas holothuriae]|uniref:Transcription antitermination protein RfaH n=1 Tax=Pseudoalteromonas holothuriae TaxID=2963714 RepID=A0A9W4VQX1_9GAMM|nr:MULTISPECIES: transcription/translation regulatory transformer protein RfaH [unclassified Pseudoalteromonas]CAH9052859.1 Transcription antitermination protein RfaH [Pseudoalteromonas sp. CIP111951]CAH9056668.1 Transcription antitermination protein RfaH [Pseudoalteromonas sp. CIP111854]
MKRWYLVYCKPKQESRALANLTQQGVEAFFPTLKRRKTAASRAVTQPLFPRYIFVHLDSYSIHFSAIKYTRGVVDFVRFGERIQEVPEPIIQSLRENDMATDLCEFALGDKVMLTDGCYKNITAIYQQADGETRSILLIKLLSQEVQIVTENSVFKKQA